MMCEWNGNIRELKNVVERHLALSENSTVKKEDLDPILFEQSVAITNDIQTWQEHQEMIKKQSLKFLEDVLSKSSSKAQAAQKIGVSRQHLHKLFEGLTETASS